MANTPAPAPAVPAAPKRAPRGRLRTLFGYFFLAEGNPGEIVIVSHSSLFYWWPVWFVGFILAGVTYFTDHHVAWAPKDAELTTIEEGRVKDAEGNEHKVENRQALVAPKGKEFPTPVNRYGEPFRPYVHSSKLPGAIFCVILLLVIIITNVPLRGLWSVLILVVIVLLSIIFSLANWWQHIFSTSRNLSLHLNMSAYLFIATALFIAWFINFFFFDRQIYMIFTPGQVKMHLEIGGGETVYDTIGMVFQKQRSDLFRHWILGFGSGDLIVRPAGAGNQHIDLPNVLRVGRRVKEIEQRLKEREVVTT
jgi:hypothetical protein